MRNHRDAACCGSARGSVRCFEFDVVLPISSRRDRMLALENGFISEDRPAWVRAFTGRSLNCSGSARSLALLFNLQGIVFASAAGPILLALLLASARPAVGAIAVAPLIGVLTLLCTNACHEAGHLLAFALVASPSRRPHAHAVARLGLAHIVRPELSAGREICVVLSGPLVAATVCGLIAFLMPHVFAAIAIACVGAGHVAALVAPVGDGANLRTALGRWSASGVRRDSGERQRVSPPQ